MLPHWILLYITNEEKEEAKKLGSETHRVTGIRSSTRIFTPKAGEQDIIGQMGQVIFHRWLDSKYIKHLYHTYNKDGSGDKFDFVIDGHPIDIDTAENRYKIPDERLHFVYFVEKHYEKFDYVVSVLIDEEFKVAKLTGYLTKDEISELPIGLFGKTKVRWCEWKKLHSITEMPCLHLDNKKFFQTKF